MTDPSLQKQALSSSTFRKGWNYIKQLPFLGKLFAYQKQTIVEKVESQQNVKYFGDKNEKVKGKAIKCDLCVGMPFEACVYNCPTSAISRRSPQDLFID